MQFFYLLVITNSTVFLRNSLNKNQTVKFQYVLFDALFTFKVFTIEKMRDVPAKSLIFRRTPVVYGLHRIYFRFLDNQKLIVLGRYQDLNKQGCKINLLNLT